MVNKKRLLGKKIKRGDGVVMMIAPTDGDGERRSC